MGFGGWWFLGGKDLKKELVADSGLVVEPPPPVDLTSINTHVEKESVVGKMNISPAGVDFIKKEEGFKANAYLDSVGVWTLGYGTIKIYGRPVRKGDVCTDAQAEEWLLDEIQHQCEPYINKLVKVPLTQEMFDTLCSFIYNLGWPSFEKSTLLKKLNEGDYQAAGDQILRWNKGKVNGVYVVIDGLVSRRRREREIFVASIIGINANVG